jgi:hypothetical protein
MSTIHLIRGQNVVSNFHLPIAEACPHRRGYRVVLRATACEDGRPWHVATSAWLVGMLSRCSATAQRAL